MKELTQLHSHIVTIPVPGVGWIYHGHLNFVLALWEFTAKPGGKRHARCSYLKAKQNECCEQGLHKMFWASREARD